MIIAHEVLWIYQPGRRSGQPPPSHEKEYFMFKFSDLEIKSQSLGNKLWLVDVSPAY